MYRGGTSCRERCGCFLRSRRGAQSGAARGSRARCRASAVRPRRATTMTSGAPRPPVARPAPSSRPRDARPRVPRSLSSRVPFPRRTTTPARPLPPATLPFPLTHPSRARPPFRPQNITSQGRRALRPGRARAMGARGRGARSRARRCRPSELGVVVAVVPGGRDPALPSSAAVRPRAFSPPPRPRRRHPLVRGPRSVLRRPPHRARGGDAPPTRRPDDARGPRGRPRARPGGDRPTPRARRRRPQSASDATRNRPGRHPKAPSDRTPRDETRRTGGESGGGSGERSGRGERVRAAARIRRLVERVEPVVGERGGVAGVGAAGPRAESAGSPRDDGGGESRVGAAPAERGVRARLAARRPHGAQRRRVRGDGAARARDAPREGRPGPSGGRTTVILRRRRE